MLSLVRDKPSIDEYTPSEDRYKYESIHDLVNPGSTVGFEILSTRQYDHWLHHDLSTIHNIGQIAAGLEGIVSINISSESILMISDEMMYRASKNKPGLVIEWIEAGCTARKVQEAAARLRSWKSNFDIRLSIDDMGKGQDGLERFLLTNPDIAKIDGSIIHGARESASYQRVFKMLCQLCRDEDVPTVAEWIETSADLDLAIDCGARYGQGFLFRELEG
ncbi:EAL domain-containing protein [Methylobacillus sp. Pita2]|uniref:EAL domain-containing protein n=1 Tax=Methylobacillus sp. Pita2 TaxID=3383245 RepID=UPI0038B58526